MQAQEYAEAKWSIGERVEGCTDADVEQALSRGEMLRTRVLRPTWHYRQPGRHPLDAAADRAARVYSQRLLHRKCELSRETLQRAHGVIAAALEGDEPLTRPELAGALAQAGIVADGLRLGYILMHAELEELMCSGPRRGKQHTYRAIREPGPRIA